MTVAMILLHRRLPVGERYPLPPREITMKLARGAGVDGELSAPARAAATMVSHFAYGGVTGAIYGAALDPRRKPAAKGMVFGLTVWLVSYLGWLPATGVLAPASEHPARRSALMIAAHIVWGLTLGLFLSLLAEENESRGPEPFSDDETPHRDLQ